MAFDLEAWLREGLQQIERSKTDDTLDSRFAALEQRLEGLESRGSITDEEKEALLAELREEREERREQIEQPKPPPAEGAGSSSPGSEPAPRTRPGRKRGGAYDWDVDEQGKVVRLDTARVWQGQDEPERVELPPEEPEPEPEPEPEAEQEQPAA